MQHVGASRLLIKPCRVASINPNYLAGAGIERNAKTWSDMYRAFLAPNVVPGVLPARQAYLSVSEMESRTSASTSYDQYEVCGCMSVSERVATLFVV